MTEKMRTVCVGRFLIDLPERAQYSLNHGQINGLAVTAIDESDEQFRARLQSREAAIRAAPDRLGGKRNMESARDVQAPNGLGGKIFVFGRKVTEGVAGSGENQERYHYENVSVEGYVHAQGLTVELTASVYDPDRVGAVENLIRQLVLNPDNQVPKEPGFCVDRVYFRDPLLASQLERAVMFAGLPDHPDVSIVFTTMAGTEPTETGLLVRNRQANEAHSSFLALARSKDLFADVRVINGIPGEQVLTRHTELDFSTSHAFMWELNGTENDVLRPFLSLELQSGVNLRAGGTPTASSLSESALLDLWQRISSTIRVRPTEAPTAKEYQPEVAPLGTIIMAGQLCPQTGWWRCGDIRAGFDALGGELQFFKQGQRVPQALLLPRQTLWEKVRGVQPSFENKSPTPWKLADRRSRKRVAPTVQLAPAMPGCQADTAGYVLQGAGSQAVCSTSTGSTCPVSGWWRCEDGEALDGVRWFRQGSILPAVTFAVPESTFGRSKGAPKAIQRRSKWILMRAAEATERSSGDSVVDDS